MVNMAKERKTLVYGEWNDSQPSKLWKILTFIFAFASLLLTAGLIFAILRERKSNSTLQSIFAEDCSNYLSINTDMKTINPDIFQDLTFEELTNVKNFLHSEKSLNLTKAEDATLRDNFIFLIENYLPDKDDVTRFLYRHGEKPKRRAKVVIMNGAAKVPNVKEFLVYPLPKPSSFNDLDVNKLGSGIPFSKRPFSRQEFQEIAETLKRINSKIVHICKESFQATLFSRLKKSLTFDVLGVGTIGNESERISWIKLQRDLPGRYFHGLPLEILIDHTDGNAQQWKIIKVRYNQQVFNTVKDFVKKYDQGNMKKIFLPWPKPETLRQLMYEKTKGDSLFNRPGRGPSITDTSGKRYGIDARHIHYASWEFHIALKPITGLAVYDVRFKKKRVAYEISLQEILSSDSEGINTNLESGLGLGIASHELIKGIDCPEHASYLDNANFVFGQKPVVTKNVICVFETNTGIPSRRHSEKYSQNMQMRYYSGHAGYGLVARVITTPRNLDYIIDFIFHLNGIVEVKTSVSGYMSSPFFEKQDTSYSNNAFRDNNVPFVDHYVLHKCDFDIDTPYNSYQTAKMTSEFVPSPSGGPILRKALKRSEKLKEMDGMTYNTAAMTDYHIVYNKKKSYQGSVDNGFLFAVDDQPGVPFPSNYSKLQHFAWAQYQTVISEYKETEIFGSSIYNQFGNGKPVYSFNQMIKDNADIVQEDLVMWITTKGSYILKSDYLPELIVTGNSFGFRAYPYGCFSQDPTISSRENVVIEHEKTSKYTLKTFGTPEKATCKLKDRKISYG